MDFASHDASARASPDKTILQGKNLAPTAAQMGGYQDRPGARKRCLVYIAGPLTLNGTHRNVHAACAIWEQFRLNDVIAICPHWSSIQDMVLPICYDSWIKYDFDLIPHCSAIFRMPGDSPGADQETALADRLGIPVFHDFARCTQYLRSIEA